MQFFVDYKKYFALDYDFVMLHFVPFISRDQNK